MLSLEVQVLHQTKVSTNSPTTEQTMIVRLVIIITNGRELSSGMETIVPQTWLRIFDWEIS